MSVCPAAPFIIVCVKFILFLVKLQYKFHLTTVLLEYLLQSLHLYIRRFVIVCTAKVCFGRSTLQCKPRAHANLFIQ